MNVQYSEISAKMELLQAEMCQPRTAEEQEEEEEEERRAAQLLATRGSGGVKGWHGTTADLLDPDQEDEDIQVPSPARTTRAASRAPLSPPQPSPVADDLPAPSAPPSVQPQPAMRTFLSGVKLRKSGLPRTKGSLFPPSSQ